MTVSRTRTGTVETGGVVVEYRIVATTERDYGHASTIEDGIIHAINRNATIPATRVTYWHTTEQTYTQATTGRPSVRFAGPAIAPVENLDPEEWSA